MDVPVLQGPTSKERKYDRQLRLWGANGQQALEDAHVLFLPSATMHAAGVETLKNLILPGIGQFTIVDDQHVTEADLGVNFFLTEDDVGASRAESCVRWLNELNPDVVGHAVHSSIHAWLEGSGSSMEGFQSYTHIIITTPFPDNILQHIRRAVPDAPIFYITCTGFYSTFTVALPPAFPIVDTHPDAQSTIDLRLLDPWPELSQYAQQRTSHIMSMDDEEHGHIPYVLLLLHYLEEWKSTHAGRAPNNYKEKSEFRELVRSGGRTSDAAGYEENYEEAVGAVLKSLNSPRNAISSSVKAVFESNECQQLHYAANSNFFLIAHAISIFYRDSGGLLPLTGTIPDMKAKSNEYIQLQTIYKTKARKDIRSVMDILRRLIAENAALQHVNVDSLQPEVEAFCKCAGHVKLLRGQPPVLSLQALADTTKTEISGMLDDEEDSTLHIWLAFLTYNNLFGTPNQAHIPTWETIEGAHDNPTDFAHDTVASALAQISDAVSPATVDLVTRHFREIARARHGELHNIAAVTGGMVAQEAIKVMTKQYVPADCIVVYDGIRSRTGVFRFAGRGVA